MRRASGHRPPSRAKLVAAFAAIYLIWGSTYLAIFYAIETLPPFLMTSARWLMAGTVLFGWAWLREPQRLTWSHWRAAAVVGVLMILGGNAMVAWAEQSVPSGLAALLIASEPLWVVLLDWMRRDGVRPSGGVIVGLLLGFGGVILLMGPGELAGSSRVDLIGAAALMTASVSWAVGSLYSRRAPAPNSPLLATSMQMLTGGVLLLLVGLATGEGAALDVNRVSWRSVVALGYLTVFGSLVSFSAYVWLLKATTIARASTYAYVNPVVAVFLGWAVAGEMLSARILLATAVIVAAVVIITVNRTRGGAQDEKQSIADAGAVDGSRVPYVHRDDIGQRVAAVMSKVGGQ